MIVELINRREDIELGDLVERADLSNSDKYLVIENRYQEYTLLNLNTMKELDSSYEYIDNLIKHYRLKLIAKNDKLLLKEIE